MVVFLTFGWVDSTEEDTEREFDSIPRAQDWLKGQRVDDFKYITMNASDDDGSNEIIVSNYYPILEFVEPGPEDLIDGEAELRSMSGYSDGF